MLKYVAIMVAPELLFISGVLKGGRQAVLLDRVGIGSLSGFSFVFVVFLDTRSTKSNVQWEDCFRTVNHKEWQITCGPAFLGAESPNYSG